MIQQDVVYALGGQRTNGDMVDPRADVRVDGRAVYLHIALNPKRLLGRHALWVNGVDVRNLPDAFAARARKRRLEHPGNLFGRVHHPLAWG